VLAESAELCRRATEEVFPVWIKSIYRLCACAYPVCLSVYELRELSCKNYIVDDFFFQSRLSVKLLSISCCMPNIDAYSIGEFNSLHLFPSSSPRVIRTSSKRRSSNRYGRSGSLIFPDNSLGWFRRKEHASCRALARKISLERVLVPISINQSDSARSGARHMSNRSPFRSFISRWAAPTLFPS